MSKEEPKQETLEEAALKHCDMLDKFPALINPLFSFKEGAKWQQDNSNINALNFEIDALKKQIELLKYQQERMYSEEEVISFLQQYRYDLSSKKTPNLGDTTKQWFEQFKKK